MVPGDLAIIIGDTGSGKTTVLQQLAECALPLPTLMFELELPPTDLFERFVANNASMTCRAVESAYRDCNDSMGEKLEIAFKNLFICTESKITLSDLENYIHRSALKIGERPRVVLIDYIQIMSGDGVSKREKISDIAEGLKVLAKQTRTIIICTSQVKRTDGEDPELGLHSAKESGSIENSCGYLLGVWRDNEDASLMHVKVLKATKGGSGTHVFCNFDGERSRIKERSKISNDDVPDHRNIRNPHRD